MTRWWWCAADRAVWPEGTKTVQKSARKPRSDRWFQVKHKLRRHPKVTEDFTIEQQAVPMGLSGRTVSRVT